MSAEAIDTVSVERFLNLSATTVKGFVLKRLHQEAPEELAAALLKAKVDRRNLLPHSCRSSLLQALNQARLEHGRQELAPHMSDGWGTHHYNVNTNRCAAYIELAEVKIVALLSAHYHWPEAFRERNLIRAWFAFISDECAGEL